MNPQKEEVFPKFCLGEDMPKVLSISSFLCFINMRKNKNILMLFWILSLLF